MKHHNFWNTLLAVCTLGIGFFAGWMTNSWIERRTSNYPLLYEAIQRLEENALYPLPEGTVLEYGMIRGLLQAYNDPYTIFLEPPQHEVQTNQLEGKYGGIGVKIERGGSGVLLYPFPNGPAAEAGVLDADLLIQVDEMPVTLESAQDQIEAALSGPVGQEVSIVVFRASVGEITFVIKRREVALPSVIYHAIEGHPHIGLLQVKLIAETTADELTTAVQNLQSDGVRHFILDLRENGGGLLKAGIDIARLFLDSGVVIEQQYKGKGVERYAVSNPGKLADLPLVVLVNQHTASAAEIVAGALQANGRASLIGAPTYGKDTIQLVFELEDGSSLHITAARWWLPSAPFPGPEFGLKPDYGEDVGDAEWVNLAITLLEQLP